MAGIYVHIPFCRSKCIYCDFFSVPRRTQMDAVAGGIARELDFRLSEISEPVTTVYFGGGTPSIMPLHLLKDILGHIPQSDVIESTIEANPDDVTKEFVYSILRMGFNRVSLGVQSLDDGILRSIGRRHTAQGALEAIDVLKNGGIHNISVDLIYGLPGQTQAGWESDVHTMLQSGITHLSAYCLTYYENTALSRMAKAGRIIPISDDELSQRFVALRRLVDAAGWNHYEISNIARPGFESKHNSSYWDPAGQWLGVGPAAYSFDGHIRRYNPDNIDLWLANLPYPSQIDEEDDLDRLNDYIVTALRTSRGLDLSALPIACADSLRRDAARFLASGDMSISDNYLSINPDRWLVADSFIREMIRCK